VAKRLTIQQENNRQNGQIWGVIVDLEYQRDLLRTIELQLPPEVKAQERIQVSLFAIRIHLEDAHRWTKLLREQVRLAQDEALAKEWKRV